MANENSGEYKHGFEGKVHVGGYELPVKSFNYKESGESAVVVNGRSNGYHEKVAGPRKMSGSCECVWDDEQYPWDTPVSLRYGQVVEITETLYTGNVPLVIVVMIDEIDSSSGSGGEVKYTFTWESQGIYELPQGA